MGEDRAMERFLKTREELNEVVLASADRVLKRVYSVDSLAFQEGALTVEVKELIGLAASLVLRCDDCVAWHVHRCLETGITPEQFSEAAGIAAVVGGTVTVPHVRRAMALWKSAREGGKEGV